MTTYKHIFHNFTDKDFTGYWNGKVFTFKPGTRKAYPELIAKHFAKHLTNDVLTEQGKETYTSPKKPTEVTEFMNVFSKAYIVQGVDENNDLELNDGSAQESMDEPSMDIKTKPREVPDPYDASSNPQTGPGSEPQIVTGDDEDDYESPDQKGKSDEKSSDDESKPKSNKKGGGGKK